MSFFSSPVFGQIASSAIGGLMSRGAANRMRGGIDQANLMRIMPYLDIRDNLKDVYKDAADAYEASRDAGFYQGQTRAGMDPRTRAGLDAGYNFGQRAVGDAGGFMDTAAGFAGNYADLYNRASQDMLGNATQYAAANAQPLIEAAMMDDRRRLEEQQLPGIQRGAMSSGNTNSSMSAVNQAIADRGFQDRRARTATNIMDRLTQRSLQSQQNQLANMTAANQNLAGLYDMGFGLAGKGAAGMTGAGSAFQADEQGRLDDERMRTEGARDYGLNLAGQYANILRAAYPGGASFGGIGANTVDPNMAALSGAMQGFGFGGNLFGGGGPVMASTGTGYFQSGGGLFGRPSGYTSFNPTPSVAVSSYY